MTICEWILFFISGIMLVSGVTYLFWVSGLLQTAVILDVMYWLAVFGVGVSSMWVEISLLLIFTGEDE